MGYKMHFSIISLCLVAIMTLSMMAVIIPATPADAQGNTIYVKSGSGGSGTSWSDAYGDLQSALDDAGTGDAIWVAAGSYTPSTEHGGSGDRYKSFQMKDGVALYGGFPSTGSPTWNDRDWQAYETILSGEIGNLGTTTDNCYHVFYHPDSITLSNSAILDGFTITRGNAADNGGGMYNDGNATTCEPVIINCVFSENNAATYGGAIYNSNAAPVVTNCTFFSNSAGSWGGAVMVETNSEPVLTNCVLTENTAKYGGAVYIKEATGRLINCILWDNSSNNIHLYFIGSTADVTYCDSEGDSGKPWFGIGCISGTPLFVNPGNRDFHLSGNSPCINAGTNSASNLPDNDFDGNPRIMDSVVDMGVDEYALIIATLITPASDISIASGDEYLVTAKIFNNTSETLDNLHARIYAGLDQDSSCNADADDAWASSVVLCGTETHVKSIGSLAPDGEGNVAWQVKCSDISDWDVRVYFWESDYFTPSTDEYGGDPANGGSGDSHYLDETACHTITQTGVIVDIYLTLQGANRPSPDGWQVPITVGFFEPGGDVLVDTPTYSFSGTTMAVSTAGGTRAYFQCPDYVNPGTYDITADSSTTLLNVKRAVYIE